MFNRLNGKGHVVAPAAGLGAALLMGSANAAISTTEILASITEGQTAAVAVGIAFGVAIWAVRGVKLMRRG